MKYQNNKIVLAQVVEERSDIRHISRHRNPDGTFDLEGNLKIWKSLIARFDSIQLWEHGAPRYDSRDPLQVPPSFVFIPAPSSEEPRGTIIIAHGGGFMTRTGCEGMHVADYFNRAGFAVAILTYRLQPFTRLDAIADMQRAIRTLRARKDALGISDKVAVMGFSAGGMLSANCATHFDVGDCAASDEIERCSCRPDAAVVCYGAFSTVSFPGGFGKSLFTDGNRAQEIYLAPEKNITADTPPFFIWQTNGDDPRHSMNLAWELTDHGIPFELHCFPDGAHGLALADGNNDLDAMIPHVMHWSTLCTEWLESLGF